MTFDIKITPFAMATATYENIINWNREERVLEEAANFGVDLDHFLALPITLKHYLGKKKAAKLTPLLFLGTFPFSMLKEVQDLFAGIDIAILDTDKYGFSLAILSGTIYDWITLIEYSNKEKSGEILLKKVEDQLRATGVLRWWQTK